MNVHVYITVTIIGLLFFEHILNYKVFYTNMV